ncbi:hypothetical protein C5E06_17565 [Pseudoclavibacter sp. RFBI5]|nr:hypothetical protein C5E06_17565 [Pseudoclavibacter sp. RFBI5]
MPPTRCPRLDGRLLRRALPPELLEEAKLREPRPQVVLVLAPGLVLVLVPGLVLVLVPVLVPVFALALVFPWAVLVASADRVANVADVAHLCCVARVLKVAATATNLLKVAATDRALSSGGVVGAARAA